MLKFCTGGRIELSVVGVFEFLAYTRNFAGLSDKPGLLTKLCMSLFRYQECLGHQTF